MRNAELRGGKCRSARWRTIAISRGEKNLQRVCVCLCACCSSLYRNKSTRGRILPRGSQHIEEIVLRKKKRKMFNPYGFFSELYTLTRIMSSRVKFRPWNATELWDIFTIITRHACWSTNKIRPMSHVKLVRHALKPPQRTWYLMELASCEAEAARFERQMTAITNVVKATRDMTRAERVIAFRSMSISSYFASTQERLESVFARPFRKLASALASGLQGWRFQHSRVLTAARLRPRILVAAPGKGFPEGIKRARTGKTPPPSSSSTRSPFPRTIRQQKVANCAFLRALLFRFFGDPLRRPPSRRHGECASAFFLLRPRGGSSHYSKEL